MLVALDALQSAGRAEPFAMTGVDVTSHWRSERN